MSYFNTPISKVTTEIYHSKLSFVGNTALNDYLTFDAPEFDNTNNVTRGSTDLVLGVGEYLASVSLGVENSQSIVNNCSYGIEIDGSIASNTGASTKNNKCGIDTAVCTVDIITGTKTLKIKIMQQNGTTTIDDDYCSFLLMRVS